MLAGGFDQAAARWADAIGNMDEVAADRCWAMLALASSDAVSLGIAGTRLSSFIRRDDSPGKKRSALLVAGLAGLGRISTGSANSYSRSNNLGLGLESSWTRMIDAAARHGQAGTVLVLTGSGLQGIEPDRIPSAHLYRALAALKATGQDYTARMIAAEALART
jgi:sugar phosphate isomerase/epimerase